MAVLNTIEDISIKIMVILLTLSVSSVLLVGLYNFCYEWFKKEIKKEEK